MGYSMEYGAGNSMAIALRDLLACPHVTLAITEHQRFNGTEAIKIVWPDPQQHSSSTFWLDESTYALIGASMAPDPGYHANARMAVAISGSLQMTWLPPTNANFALFNVHVPPGFAEAS